VVQVKLIQLVVEETVEVVQELQQQELLIQVVVEVVQEQLQIQEEMVDQESWL
jgi:hypothetical protein